MSGSQQDGVSPNIVGSNLTTSFDELWDVLVPDSGPAATKQGEVIRLSGKISRELLDNDGLNWDKDFRAMKRALIRHLGSGTPASAADELEALSKRIRRDRYDEGDPFGGPVVMRLSVGGSPTTVGQIRRG